MFLKFYCKQYHSLEMKSLEIKLHLNDACCFHSCSQEILICWFITRSSNSIQCIQIAMKKHNKGKLRTVRIPKYSIPSRSSNTPSQFHAKEIGISSGNVGQFGPSVAYMYLYLLQIPKQLATQLASNCRFCHIIKQLGDYCHSFQNGEQVQCDSFGTFHP